MNNGTIPSISPVAALRGGEPLAPEKSINYTAGVVLDTGEFSLTADYFRISVSDRIGITSNFTLLEPEIEGLLAEGIEAARDLRRFRFFTNAFSTTSQGVDLVSTFTPLALRGNTTISAVFNYTDTEVTDNRKGLLNDRRLTELVSARKPPFRAEICANSWHPERDFGTNRPRRRRLTGCGIAEARKSARMSCFQGQ